MADEKAPETPETPQTETQPRYMTVDDFNRGASARDKRLMGQIEKLLETRLSSLTQRAAAPADDPDDDEPHAAPAQGQQAAPEDRRFAKLERQLAKERAAREAAEKATAERDAKASRDDERARLSGLLQEAGISGAKLKAAVAVLHTEDRRVKRDADGSIVFVADDGDEVPLAAGIKTWLNSEEGKTYLPPRGSSGSGATPGKAARTVGDVRANARAQLGPALVAHLLGGGRG